MAISIEVFIERTEEPQLMLRDDTYWYLYPMFEQINAHTGRCIMLLGKCTFPVESLPILQQYVFEKKHTIRQLKPSVITFVNGNIVRKSKNGRLIKKNNVVEVNKSEVLYFLTEVSKLIDEAKQHAQELRFVGC